MSFSHASPSPPHPGNFPQQDGSPPAGPPPGPKVLDRQARPFTPETLAERWGCSGQKIRDMFHSGELPGFRLGKLIRIPVIEVERYECVQTELETAMSSSAIEESLPSRSDAARIAGDIRRVLTTRAPRG